MTTTQPTRTPTPSRNGQVAKLFLSAAVVMVGAATVAVTSLALFTDTATVGANVFTTGTIDINASPASAVVTMPAMAPGDQVTAPLTVSNDGSLELRYAIESTTTEDVLASELVLTVKSGVTACTDAGWAADGTTLYAGRLGSTGTDPIVGSAAPGADAGDRVLVAATNEVLCFNVTLPLASTAGQGATTTATFDFLAEQTANNP
jgi:predicted ribosomally synthesized peptide with SipW-like signal peptide